MLPRFERIGPDLVHCLVLGSNRRNSETLSAPTTSGVVARLAIDRQQVLAGREHERPAANHHPFFERDQERIAPCLAAIFRKLGRDPRGAPGVAEADDVEDPHQSVRRLPDHDVAIGIERRVGDHLGLGPLRLAGFLAHAIVGRLLGILAVAAVVGDIQIAVVELLDRGRMLVLAGILGADDALEGDVA